MTTPNVFANVRHTTPVTAEEILEIRMAIAYAIGTLESVSKATAVRLTLALKIIDKIEDDLI